MAIDRRPELSRTGIEKKPPWSSVPQQLKDLIGLKLGSPVVRGVRIWGSYGPGPSFRLLLENGDRAFTKSLSPASSAVQRRVFAREIRVYRELNEHISPWAPAYLGEAVHGLWHALLLEDLGPKSAPPWSASMARTAAHGLAALHTKNRGTAFPDWVHDGPQIEVLKPNMWHPETQREKLKNVAELATDPVVALEWLEQHLPALSNVPERQQVDNGEQTLLHLDTRSDNLRVAGGSLRLFDWPFACIGPPELDIVAFAQTVWAEGYFDGETVLRWYGESKSLRQDVVTAAVVAVSDLFADRSWRDDVPGLPRLRSWQRAQLKVTLRWAAERLGLPDPSWVDGVV